ncbi:type IV pilin protein [Candidatus Avelusimicrobium faecicola]|uniref:type IV pilin protein n=1 Tax=Candidatus Avelusimicrobium faecicola TaxID=3416205 RepID=UPI003D10087A
MKNANISRLGGFTLIELLVVVLIIGILAAMAMPQYFKAVERARMAEAITLMDSIVKSQRRKYMQTNRYTSSFVALDIGGIRPQDLDDRYFTKGIDGNGFEIRIDGGVSATRYDGTNHNLQYAYQLTRDYDSDVIWCYGSNTGGNELCADFCGLDTPPEYGCSTAGEVPVPPGH